MKRRLQIPRDDLREFFRHVSHPKTRTVIARTIANYQHATRRNAFRQVRQQDRLLLKRQVMQHIKENNIAREIRQRLLNIPVTKINVLVVGLGDALSVPNLSRIQIESEE